MVQTMPSISDEIDLLDCLPAPKGTSMQYKENEVIYTPNFPEPRNLYVVTSGRVMVKSLNKGPFASGNFGIEIVSRDGVFGLEALTGAYTTTATCAADTMTLSWGVGELHDLMGRDAKVRMAIIRALVARNAYYQHRLEEFAGMPIRDRLAAFLMEQLAIREAAGEEVVENGWAMLPAMTQDLLSEYVGTSREIVTSRMNEFRKGGHIRYNRKGIGILNPMSFIERVAVKRAAPANKKSARKSAAA